MTAGAVTRPAARRAARLLLPALLLAGAVHAGADRHVVATVDDRPVHRDELLAAAAFALEEAELQRLRCEAEADRNHDEVLRTFLRDLVHGRLLDLEAGRTGSTADGLLASARASAPPVETEQVEQFYLQNRERIPYALTEVADQIRAFLKQQAEQRAEAEFLDTLERRFAVDYRLEPFRVAVDADGFATRGPADAPVTIVEFSDFECPFCASVLPALERAGREYAGKVRIVYRHFPLTEIHPHAQKAAEAALCAGDQGAFWELHDLMFAEQGALSVADLKDKAGRIGLDRAAFDACLDSDRHYATVRVDVRAAAAAGVSGTPALFVNGRPLAGAAPFDTIAAAIDDELERLGVR